MYTNNGVKLTNFCKVVLITLYTNNLPIAI